MEESEPGRFRRIVEKTIAAVRDTWSVIGLTLLLLLVLEAAYRGQAEIRRALASGPQSEVEGPLSEDWVPDYLEELRPSKGLAWRPFVYYRRKPFSGTYINVDSLGHRITPQDPAEDSGRKVWLFGGSTMWGWDARDHKTIPAILADSLVSRGLRGIEVTNFGETGYVFTQEAIELALQLRDGARPDVVVFYDGINDTFSLLQNGVAGVAQNETNRASDFDLGRTMAPSEWSGTKLRDDLAAGGALVGLGLGRSQLLQRLIAGVSTPWSESLPADHVDLFAASYLSTAELVQILGEHYGFVPFFFWQPSLHATGKALTPHEQGLMDWVESDAFHSAGRRVLVGLGDTLAARAASRAIDGFENISGVFDGRTETIFVDHIGHTTEAANEIVVGGMVELVVEALAGGVPRGDDGLQDMREE